MLSKFEEIGPLQEHTSVYHLIIELIIQAMRWGPPSAVGCCCLIRVIMEEEEAASDNCDRINQMIKHSITPIFCFEGLRNPGKAATDGDRDQARQEGKKKAMELFSAMCYFLKRFIRSHPFVRECLYNGS
jgi:hypothetical protein